jgi:hypothetical protein
VGFGGLNDNTIKELTISMRFAGILSQVDCYMLES